ncbi:MAG: zinc ribbon domain-containing protein [Candidatus Nitrosotenuis sp.]|nr:zinc ribbon domain-containing protein [Candidatus Nitrosotenuis sp.]
MARENEWIGKNVDLKLLAERIHKFFEDDGFHEIRIEEDPNGTWYEIQARKTGVLRTLGSSRKAIHIVIKGSSNKFNIEMGVGEWGKNIGVAALLTGGIGLIGLGFDVKFQNKVWNFIKNSVDSLSNSKSMQVSSVQPSNPNTDSKFCIKCGVKIPEMAQFCPSCGSPQT